MVFTNNGEAKLRYVYSNARNKWSLVNAPRVEKLCCSDAKKLQGLLSLICISITV